MAILRGFGITFHFDDFLYRMVEAMNLKTFKLFAVGYWGGLRPAMAWENGKCFIPIILGVWIRWPFGDRMSVYHTDKPPVGALK